MHEDEQTELADLLDAIETPPTPTRAALRREERFRRPGKLSGGEAKLVRMADEAREMAELVFDLQYDGPALQTHEMNVRDLAPALVATAELFQEMNRLARPTDPDISVNVRATGAGSFLVELKLFYEATVGLLGSVDATALVNLGTLLHWLGSLISLRRKRSASAITGQDEPDEEGLVRVTFADATQLEVPAAVLQFDRNVTIRQNLSE